MKLLTKITKIILPIAVLVILPIVVFTFLTSKTTVFGLQSFVVLSGSMTPTLSVGSIIYTQQQKVYGKGDVIAFKSGDANVTHRIIKANSDGSFITRGDANNIDDEKPLTSRDILGKQMFSVPYLGKLILFLKTPQGFFPIVVFPAVVFIVLEFWNMKKEIEKQAEIKMRKKLETASVSDQIYKVNE